MNRGAARQGNLTQDLAFRSGTRTRTWTSRLQRPSCCHYTIPDWLPNPIGLCSGLSSPKITRSDYLAKPHGIADQEAPQADAQEEAQEDAQEDALAAQVEVTT